MNSNKLFLFTGVLFIFIIVGICFINTTISKEPVVENEEIQLTKNNSKIKNNSKGLNSQNKQNDISPQKTKSIQLVVDQILQSAVLQEVKVQEIKNVLGAENEKINLEITLFDGEKNKLLTEYELEIKCDELKNLKKAEKAKSDNKGKFSITINQIGFRNIQILTKDFAVHSDRIFIHQGHNQYKAKLYKGGTVEIRATDLKNVIVGNLMVKLGYGSSFQAQDNLLFDSLRGVYVLSGMPLGIQYISFKAPNFQETPNYLINISSKKNEYVEIKLQQAQIINFELELKTKPDFINIYRGHSFSYGISEYAKADVVKNNNNLFKYELKDQFYKSLIVAVGQYLPQEVRLVDGQDTYKLNFQEGFVGELKICNKEGKPVKGARVAYQVGVPEDKEFHRQYNGYSPSELAFSKDVVSDENGVALLIGLNEKMSLKCMITHSDYLNLTEFWAYDSKAQNSKKITFSERKGASGKIKNAEKLVKGAQVYLYPNGSNIPLSRVYSDENGHYFFNNLEDNKDKLYVIKAYHQDYGVATSPIITYEIIAQKIDLTLISEKSLAIKLVDNTGAPLSNKKITLNWALDRSDNTTFNIFLRSLVDIENSIIVYTNELGQYEYFNIPHGHYFIFLEDEQLKLNSGIFKIPSVPIVLKSEQKILIKLIIKMPDGQAFNGKLTAKESRSFRPLEVNLGEDGFNYLSIPWWMSSPDGAIIFDIPNYPVVALGPFNMSSDIPKELAINLTEGKDLTVKVLADRDNREISLSKVDILCGEALVQSKQSNEKGEVTFSNLSGKLNISIKENGYASYISEIDLSQRVEFIARVQRGGVFKGHLSLDKNIEKAWVNLGPNYKTINLDKQGDFKCNNLTPGEYSVSLTKVLKDGNKETFELPTKIIVENEKTVELNLDSFLKK